MVTPIDGSGTPESDWLPYLSGQNLPALQWQPPPRVLLVAPHPDDEVLGAGGLGCLLAAAGVRVEVVAVTDGAASHPGSTRTAGLAERRAQESAAACALLGLPEPRRLGLPDGGAETLEDPVAAALDPGQADWVLTVWDRDGHPDHEAVGRGAGRAAREAGARLLHYPVWAWHWARPGDPRLPWQRAATVALPPDVQHRKAQAVAQFVSQLHPLGPAPADAPVLSQQVLQRFSRPYEVVFQ